VQGELTDEALIENAVKGADAVISVLGPTGGSSVIKPCFYKFFALPLDHGLWPNGIRLSQILLVARLGQIDQKKKLGYWALLKPILAGLKKEKRALACRLYVER
jgi:hypothetical protein